MMHRPTTFKKPSEYLGYFSSTDHKNMSVLPYFSTQLKLCTSKNDNANQHRCQSPTPPLPRKDHCNPNVPRAPKHPLGLLPHPADTNCASCCPTIQSLVSCACRLSLPAGRGASCRVIRLNEGPFRARWWVLVRWCVGGRWLPKGWGGDKG